MRHVFPWFVCSFFLAGLLCLPEMGCARERMTGTVTDNVGERLPGVAVSLTDEHGHESQTLTDGLGEYGLPFTTGRVKISFLKNGYTTGHIELALDSSSVRKISPVALWRLPQEEGVFFYDNNRYRRLTPFEPRTVVAQATNVVTFGIPLMGAVEEIPLPEPLLLLRRFANSDIMHRVPGFDVQVSRLAPIQTYVSGNSGPVQETWIQTDKVVCAVDPIDEPEHYLIQIRLTDPLKPGTYAVHWGSFSGYTRSESRAFVFRVPSPPQEEKTENKGDASKAGAIKSADTSSLPAKK